MLSLNKSYKNRKVPLTVQCKCKYFDSTVHRAEDRRQKFYFCFLPFAVKVKLNLSINVINYVNEYTTKMRVKKRLVLGNKFSVKLVLCELKRISIH